VQKFRSEAALAANAWKEYSDASEASDFVNDTGNVVNGELDVLTIEMISGNIIIHAVQPNLLLILVGINDRKNNKEDFADRFHPEYKGDDRYPSTEDSPTSIAFLGPTTQDKSGTATPKMGSPPSEGLQRTLSHRSVAGSAVSKHEHSLAILNFQRTKLDGLITWFKQQLDVREFVFKES
jgi:hypothetical protein